MRVPLAERLALRRRKSTPLSVNFARTNKQLLLLYRFVVGSYCY